MYAAEDFLGQNGVDDFAQRARVRTELINEVLWDESAGIHTDFNFVQDKLSTRTTLATVFPLFVNIASPERAARVAKFLEDKLLKNWWFDDNHSFFWVAVECTKWGGGRLCS